LKEHGLIEGMALGEKKEAAVKMLSEGFDLVVWRETSVD
jgi:hypothetical protein